jgi:Tfp pilus assembly protein PilZ
MARRLRLPFADAAEFRKEYERNIVNGGAFIRTAEEFEVRELAEVELELGFCGDSVVLEAEIVHFVGAEQADSEEAVGVAVQFLEPAPQLRDALQRFIDENVPTRADVAEPVAEDPTGVAEDPPGHDDVISDDLEGSLGDVYLEETSEPAAEDSPGHDDVTSIDLEELPEEVHLEEMSEGPVFDPSEVDLPQSREEEDPLAAALDRRKAPRVRTRVQARVDAKSMSLEGHTRDLSRSGALVSADASDLPVGKAVTLELVHPVTGEELEVEGSVSRHVETEGTVAAVGIEFGPEASDDGVAAFVEDASQAETERQRTGIYGAIQELGMAALLRMFALNARRGTLTVTSGVEDGTIGFENGILRHVQLGEVRGVKALSRFLTWERGDFEFHARLDPADGEPVAVAVEEAIQEAIRQREDMIRAELTDMLDPAACFAIDGEALRGENGLSKTEEAVLDLVAARFSVRRILDVIPQPDAEVIEALRSLLDGEVIRPV